MNLIHLRMSIKRTEFVRNRYVVKSNHLISRVHQLSMQSQKLFCVFVALINSKRYAEPYYWLSLRELSELLGMDKYNDYRKEVVRLINELQDGSMVWLDEVTAVNYISAVKFTDDGLIHFEFPEALRKHVGFINNTYTKYPLGEILPLKNAYSLRMYELMKKDLHSGKMQYSVSDLRNLLNVDERKYLKFFNFQNRVLNTAINEINLKTDLKISYECLKNKGKKEIVGLEFTIKRNTKELHEYSQKLKNIMANTEHRKKDFKVPDGEKNSAAFNQVYRNYVENLDNYPEAMVFDDYLKVNGFRIKDNDRGGRDIEFIQYKLNI